MIKAIVTDIEGTTTSVDFVYDCLFPYAKQRLVDFLREQQATTEVAAQISAMQDLLGAQASLEQISQTLLQWMAEDKKHTVLKALQGMIWQQGYVSGEIQGHIYPDVVPALTAWKQQGIALYVYSSGSVQAQKLLFGYSQQGDLTPLFSGYFDTTTGAKREASAYQSISQQLQLEPSQILFLSDIVQELAAAKQAGFQTIGLARAGGQLAGHLTVRSFAEINIAKQIPY